MGKKCNRVSGEDYTESLVILKIVRWNYADSVKDEQKWMEMKQWVMGIWKSQRPVQRPRAMGNPGALEN